jgi:glycosyltransferase involved in cell wall biosynthesis
VALVKTEGYVGPVERRRVWSQGEPDSMTTNAIDSGLSECGRFRVRIYTWMDPENPRAGGDVRYLAEIGERLVRDGFEVVWIASRFPGSEPDSVYRGIRVLRSGSLETVYFTHHVDSRVRELRECEFTIETLSSVPFFLSSLGSKGDIAFIHHVVPFAQMARKVGVLAPLAYFLDRWLSPRLYRRRRVLVPSRATLDEVRRLGYQDVGVFRPGTDVFDSNLGIKEDLIVAPGPIKPWKHHDDIIRAFEEVDNQWRLAIFGSYETSGLKKHLTSLVNQSSARDRIRLLGRVSEWEKREILAKSSICVLASEKEGWGLAAMEAQSSGCPIVAYRVPGLTETVEDSVSGFLVSPRTPVALAAGLRRLTSSPDLRRTMAAAAIRHAGMFDYDRSYSDFMEQMKSVLVVGDRPRGSSAT